MQAILILNLCMADTKIKGIYFYEKQRFTQWWLWMILVAINGLFFYGLVQQLFFKIPFGDKPMSNSGLLITFAGSLILSYLFFSIKLETTIAEDGIYVRFYPFLRKMRYYPWHEIDKYYVRQYKPISEYGGWGLRGFTDRNMAFNVKGNHGLQLELKGAKRLLIGTQQSEHLKSVLSRLHTSDGIQN